MMQLQKHLLRMKARKGIIVDVVKKGYYLQDKIIRHAKVVVGE